MNISIGHVGQLDNINNRNKMKIKRLKLEPVIQKERFKDEGIVAFQMVEFTIDFYGLKDVFIEDTKILEDGRQIVIDGNGFVEGGTDITNL